MEFPPGTQIGSIEMDTESGYDFLTVNNNKHLGGPLASMHILPRSLHARRARVLRSRHQPVVGYRSLSCVAHSYFLTACVCKAAPRQTMT